MLGLRGQLAEVETSWNPGSSNGRLQALYLVAQLWKMLKSTLTGGRPLVVVELGPEAPDLIGKVEQAP